MACDTLAQQRRALGLAGRGLAQTVLLAAVLLWSFMAAGLMPERTADGGLSMVICTPNGLVEMELPGSGEAPNPDAAGADCPFAVAPALDPIARADLNWSPAERRLRTARKDGPVVLARLESHHTRSRAPPQS